MSLDEFGHYVRKTTIPVFKKLAISSDPGMLSKWALDSLGEFGRVWVSLGEFGRVWVSLGEVG